MQKSLQGLDNLTAEGAEAFEHLQATVKALVELGAEQKWGQTVQQALKDAKRYLKTDFKTHVGRQEHCKDHCIVYALSDPGNPEFSGECYHDHSASCERCDALLGVFDEISRKLGEVDMTSDQRARMKFEYEKSERSVRERKAHLLRSIAQEESKHDVLRQLDDNTCLIIMDWAMKYLPQRYREQMSEFFGKRGRSWHVSAVITRKEERYEVECFVHLLNSCTQNSFSVVSIIEHVLVTVKQEYPEVTRAFFRSDNAGCYHNGSLLASLRNVGESAGVVPVRYDFSEPQAGKDISDRKIAPMKAHIKRWVNEKHDVITAEDMKTALESHGGLKGCRAAVVEVDGTKEVGKYNKIPQVSLLHNFAFEEKGIRAWRAYDVGDGRFIAYDSLDIEAQHHTGLKVIHPFGGRSKEKGIVGASARPKADIFPCFESDCVLTFRSEAEAEAHMDTAEHMRVLESESLYDSIRKKWAATVTGVTPHAQQSSDPDHHSIGSGSAGRLPLGWALKTVRKSVRMTEKVKAFLVRKFNAGATSGQKADPIQVSKDMKFAKDESGKSLFNADEWRTSSQVASFFSRLSALQRQTEALKGREGERETAEDDDMAAWESEAAMEALKVAVLSDMGSAICHPIEVGGRNICQLVRANKLDTLKLAELKGVCQKLQLKVAGSLVRKKSFIEPLAAYARACPCAQS